MSCSLMMVSRYVRYAFLEKLVVVSEIQQKLVAQFGGKITTNLVQLYNLI